MANLGARLAGLSRPLHSAFASNGNSLGGLLAARPASLNPVLHQSRRWTAARSFATQGSTEAKDNNTSALKFESNEIKLDEKDKQAKSTFASPGPIPSPTAEVLDDVLDDGSIIELSLPAVAPIHLRLPEDQASDSEVLEWYKEEGDLVEAGDSICEIDTDVFSYDFSSPSTGYLAKIIAPAGTKGLPSEAAIAWLAEEKDQITDVAMLAEEKYGGAIAAAKAAKKKRKDDEKAEVIAKAEAAAAAEIAATAAATAAATDDHKVNLSTDSEQVSKEEEEQQQQEEVDEEEDDEEDVVVSFLESLDADMTKYATAFRSDGFDSLGSILTLTDDDLGTLGVRKGHRRLILAEIEEIKVLEAEEIKREMSEADKPKERV